MEDKPVFRVSGFTLFRDSDESGVTVIERTVIVFCWASQFRVLIPGSCGNLSNETVRNLKSKLRIRAVLDNNGNINASGIVWSDRPICDIIVIIHIAGVRNPVGNLGDVNVWLLGTAPSNTKGQNEGE